MVERGGPQLGVSESLPPTHEAVRCISFDNEECFLQP